MALVTRDPAASPDGSTGMFAPQISGLLAGENIEPAQPCYIKSDGTVWLANGTAADALAKVRGFATRSTRAGQPVTLYGRGARFRYATAMTPGIDLFLFTTAGTLGDAATTGGTVPIAFAVSATDIIVLA